MKDSILNYNYKKESSQSKFVWREIPATSFNSEL
jgi:hypothetical protein